MTSKAIPIAVQLYSVRGECAKDLGAVLKAVAEMGYAGVEFAGYHNHGAGELRRMLDDLGLKAAGAHIGLDSLLGDELKKTVEFHRTIGNQFLIVPGLAEERRNSKAAWKQTAILFSEIAAKLKAEGMRTGYHNHTVEFTPMEGENPWDVFAVNSSRDVVLQFDTGNALLGGGDPVLFMERYPGRSVTVHLKEFSKTNDKALIGEGDVNWKRVLEICRTTGGTEWYIIEQESYAYPPLECIKLCLANLKRMLDAKGAASGPAPRKKRK